MTLTERCSDILRRIGRLEGSRCPPELTREKQVDELYNFVLSEIGRAADERLEDCARLVLYFADESGREELLAALLAGKPGMVSKRWPE